MADEIPDGTNLVPPRADRRTLAKMRGKLATSSHKGKKAETARPARPKRHIRILPFVIGLGLALAGMEIALHASQDSRSGPAAGGLPMGSRIAPPPGLSLDEQARFWCYAAYDYPKLKARFKPPKGAINDSKQALRNLENLLAENLGNAVRNEIFAYQQAHPDPAAAKILPAGPITRKK
jgi:hypothetical protein